MPTAARFRNLDFRFEKEDDRPIAFATAVPSPLSANVRLTSSASSRSSSCLLASFQSQRKFRCKAQETKH